MNKALKTILIKTKRAVFSEIVGNNSSLFKGEGYDFVELREYESGEDVKKIDWIISAKLQKPYVKVFQSQRELNIAIVPILSGSVYFGTHKFKQEVIAEICAILGYSSVRQGDPYISFIANEKVEPNTKKTKKIFGVYDMTQKVYNYNVLGKQNNYKNITDELYQKIKKRSIIFLIGDFFDINDLDLKLLSYKHEVIAIIVRDQFEENPSELGSLNLIDPSNSSQSFEGDLNRGLIKNYKAQIKQNDHDLFLHLQKCGIKFVKIYTHEEPIGKLLGLMLKR